VKDDLVDADVEKRIRIWRRRDVRTVVFRLILLLPRLLVLVDDNGDVSDSGSDSGSVFFMLINFYFIDGENTNRNSFKLNK